MQKHERIRTQLQEESRCTFAPSLSDTSRIIAQVRKEKQGKWESTTQRKSKSPQVFFFA